MGNMYIDSMTNKHFSFCLFFFITILVEVFFFRKVVAHTSKRKLTYTLVRVYT